MFEVDKIYRRPDDMSCNQELQMLAQPDGDVIMEIVNIDTMERMQIEFCLSGGRSHNTLNAARALIEAMIEDDKERPYHAAPSAIKESRTSGGTHAMPR